MLLLMCALNSDVVIVDRRVEIQIKCPRFRLNRIARRRSMIAQLSLDCYSSLLDEVVVSSLEDVCTDIFDKEVSATLEKLERIRAHMNRMWLMQFFDRWRQQVLYRRHIRKQLALIRAAPSCRRILLTFENDVPDLSIIATIGSGSTRKSLNSGYLTGNRWHIWRQKSKNFVSNDLSSDFKVKNQKSISGSLCDPVGSLDVRQNLIARKYFAKWRAAIASKRRIFYIWHQVVNGLLMLTSALLDEKGPFFKNSAPATARDEISFRPTTTITSNLGSAQKLLSSAKQTHQFFTPPSTSIDWKEASFRKYSTILPG